MENIDQRSQPSKHYVFLKQNLDCDKNNVVEPFESIDKNSAINSGEIEELAEKNEQIMMYYRLEELFVVVLNNLVDFNTYIYNLSDKSRYTTYQRDVAFDWNIEAGVKAINYLSAFQIYFAYVKSFVMYNNNKNKREEMKKFLSPFENEKAYKQCIFLRNYSQHSGMFNLVCTVSSRRLFSSVFTIMDISVETKDLCSKTTREHEDAPQKLFGDVRNINLYKLFNESFDLLQACQKCLREMFESDYTSICNWLTTFNQKCDGRTLCELIINHEGKRSLKPVFIGFDTITRTDVFRKKHLCRCPQSNNFVANFPLDFETRCKEHDTLKDVETCKKRECRFGGYSSPSLNITGGVVMQGNNVVGIVVDPKQ